jgi:hypothetical protein
VFTNFHTDVRSSKHYYAMMDGRRYRPVQKITENTDK